MSSNSTTTPLPSSSTSTTSSSSSTSTTSSSSSSSSSSSNAGTSSSSSTTGSSPSSTDQSSSGSATSSTSQTSLASSTLSSSSTTTLQTTILTTAPDGQVSTTVIRTQSVLPPGSTVSPDSSSSSGSSSHIGAIVGGAVGGGAGLIILLLLIGICWRRNRRRQKSLDAFDGNFDPDRIVTQKPVKGEPKILRGQDPTLPNVSPANDIEDDGMGGRLAGSAMGAGIVAPYPLHHPTNAPEMSAQTSSASHGIPASVYAAAYANDNNVRPGAASHSSPGSGASSVSTHTPYGVGANDHLPNPFSAGPGSTVSSSANSGAPGGSGAGYNRFNVANPDADSPAGFVGGFAPMTGRGEKSAAGPSGANRSRDVLVHQDGGRMEESAPHDEGPDEIPPTYDSLVPGSSSVPRAREKR